MNQTNPERLSWTKNEAARVTIVLAIALLCGNGCTTPAGFAYHELDAMRVKVRNKLTRITRVIANAESELSAADLKNAAWDLSLAETLIIETRAHLAELEEHVSRDRKKLDETELDMTQVSVAQSRAKLDELSCKINKLLQAIAQATTPD